MAGLVPAAFCSRPPCPPPPLAPGMRTPPPVTSLSCPSCLERKPKQGWPRSPGGSLRVSGLGLCWARLPRGRLTCRPRCHGLSAGQPLPQSWPWTLSPRGAALVGVRLRCVQAGAARGPTGDLPPLSPFLSSRAHLVPGAGPLGAPATLAFHSPWALRSPRARQGAKMSGQAGPHQGGGPSAAGVASWGQTDHTPSLGGSGEAGGVPGPPASWGLPLTEPWCSQPWTDRSWSREAGTARGRRLCPSRPAGLTPTSLCPATRTTLRGEGS